MNFMRMFDVVETWFKVGSWVDQRARKGEKGKMDIPLIPS
jgi:hypothetical protein